MKKSIKNLEEKKACKLNKTQCIKVNGGDNGEDDWYNIWTHTGGYDDDFIML